MSKLLDRLDKLNRGVTASMGFGPSARSETLPAMALIGMLPNVRKSIQASSNLAKTGVDGALIEAPNTEKMLTELSQTLKDVPWGIRVQELAVEQASQYKDQGCDFLAFSPQTAPVGALEDRDTAYLLCISPDMDERALRAIEDLPVDVVLLPSTSVELPLTLQHLITISSVRSTFSKYLLLEVPGVPTAGELEGLRDIGVDGLVIDATSVSAWDLGKLKEGISSVPRRQRSRETRASAILPRTAYTLGRTPSHEGEEEDDL